MKKLLLIPILLLLTSCTDYRELSDMALVGMIAIDKTDTYNVIVQVLDYSLDEEKKENIITYKNSANTLHEAFRGITLTSPKKLYLGHVKVVIVSENLAKNDITSIFDFILRDAEMEKDFSIILTKDIDEIMNIKLNDIPSENIKNKIYTASIIEGSTHDVTFDNFVEESITNGIDPVLPIIYKDNDKLSFYPYLAIFYKNKLEAYLSEESTIGFNILNNYLDGSVISFKCDNNNYASIELNSYKTKINYNDKTNTFNIDINMNGSLSEIECNIDLGNNDEIKKLNDKLNTRIKEIITKTITDNKIYNSDFLGLEKLIYKNNYKFYKNNNIKELIKESNININVNTEFISKGSIKKYNEKY